MRPSVKFKILPSRDLEITLAENFGQDEIDGMVAK